jgi:hypothetical protein
MIFNFEKTRNSLAIKKAEKKGRWVTNLTFFCLIMEKQITTITALHLEIKEAYKSIIRLLIK